ncbi:ISAs1 family transposase [Acaryochloris sp. IP29b_bin.137]|uniref:ISAs1 family transposase n=1 Tax=Acaryochloris sp. IP29b_bin.137 TaxID=2969217 RepID=UPI002635184D|nr:ISAs1 family transposase [Acaryochloris sp. IP29b_bin.137]
MPSRLKKTAQLIIESGNEYLGALKGNQKGLLAEVKAHFQPEQTLKTLEKGHGRIEKRTVSICRDLSHIRPWPGLNTLIRVESQRSEVYDDMIVDTQETRYYITSLLEEVKPLAQRIRGYWGVENKVHYVRDVTQGEDASRIRTTPLIGLFVQARNLALNLYREHGFTNMAQAKRRCEQSFDMLMDVFRMK